MSTESSGPALDNKTWTIVIWALYIGGFVTGISSIVGIILAYVKRAEMVGTPFESHITSAIRTFWIALIAGVIGVVLLVVAIGFVILIAVAIWTLYRSVRGLVLALDSKPVPNPTGWL